jgi:hypothetical protein
VRLVGFFSTLFSFHVCDQLTLLYTTTYAGLRIARTGE